MDAKILKLYTVLQPHFPQDWRIGDKYTLGEDVKTIESSDFGFYDEFIYKDIEGVLHLPLPIDPADNGPWFCAIVSRWREERK